MREQIYSNPEGLPNSFYEYFYQFDRDFEPLFQTYEERERPVLGLSSLVIFSGLFKNIWGRYDKRYVHPCLYLFVVGSPGSGKGSLNDARKIAYQLHKHRWETYLNELKEYKLSMLSFTKKLNRGEDVGEEPEKPKKQFVLLPSDITAPRLLKDISEEPDNCGIYLESEAGTITQLFSSEHGNFSTTLRKAYHHETISIARISGGDDNGERTFHIERPKIALAISGTPNDVPKLFNKEEAENGLYSRFLFYQLEYDDKIRGFLNSEKNNRMELFDNISQHVLNYFMHNRYESEAVFTQSQSDLIRDYTQSRLDKAFMLYGEKAKESIVRDQLRIWRIAVVLACLRHSQLLRQDISSFTVSDDDVNCALETFKALEAHQEAIFTQYILKEQPEPLAKLPPGFVIWYGKLPKDFDRKLAVEIAEEMALPISTMKRHLTNTQLFLKYAHGKYEKLL